MFHLSGRQLKCQESPLKVSEAAALIAYRRSSGNILSPTTNSKVTAIFRILQLRKTVTSLPKMPQAQPELKKVRLRCLFCTICVDQLADNPQYMEKRVFCQLNGNRKVIGVLRGYDVRSITPSLPCSMSRILLV